MLLCNRIYYMDNALLDELSIHVAGDLIYMLLCNRIYYMDDPIYNALLYEFIVHVV